MVKRIVTPKNRPLGIRAIAGLISCTLAGSWLTLFSDCLPAAAEEAPMDLLSFQEQISELTAADSYETCYDSILLTEGSDTAQISDGRTVTLSAEPETVNGVFMVPADFLAEQSGMEYVQEEHAIMLESDSCQVTLQAEDDSCFSDESAAAYFSGDTLMVSIDAAEDIGFTVTETAAGAELSNPFQLARLIVKASGEVDSLGAVQAVEGYQNLHIFQYASPADAYAAYERYQTMQQVEYVEASAVVSICAEDEADAISDGEEVSAASIDGTHYTWGAEALKVDAFCALLDAKEEPLPELTVAVIDTGLCYTHPWFENRIAEGGMDFTAAASSNGVDDHGHGTHVAGTICDLTLENVKILPVKVLSSSGSGSTEQVYCGMMYAISQGVDFMNLSLGAKVRSTLFEEATHLAVSQNIVVCVAAGNSTLNAENYTPAGIPEAITVSAVNTHYELADFSNFGACIDFTAPGTQIVSAFLNNGLKTYRGTSMAAPHVTACFALLKSYCADWTPQELELMLSANAVDLGTPGFDESFGHGLISVDFSEFYSAACAAPVASVSGGDFESGGFSVSLTTETEQAAVYYTTDGSLPSASNGTLYTDPIWVEATTVLQAVTVKEGCYSSRVIKEIYCVGGLELAHPFVVEDGILTACYAIYDEITVPETVDGMTVTAVGDGVFADRTDLTSVALPDTVASLGADCFSGCTALTSVTAKGVVGVGDGAFRGCSALETLEIGILDMLGTESFSGCELLTEVKLSDAVTVLPDAVFWGCELLTTLSAPSVTAVGDQALAGCSSLEEIQLDFSNLRSLGDGAFQNCGHLMTQMELPALESIGAEAFSGCSRLTVVSLPQTIRALPDGCLEGCSGLVQFRAPGVTKIGDAALAVGSVCEDFSAELNWAGITSLGSYGLKGIRLPETVCFSALTEAGEYALSHVYGSSVECPALTQIPAYFLQYAQLQAVSLPAALQVAQYAVSYSGLEWILLGADCVSIDSNALIGYSGQIGGYEDTYPDAVAEARSISFAQAPVLPEANQSIAAVRGVPVTLSALGMGTNLTYQWYQLLDGQQIPISGACDQTYVVCSEQTGIYEYVCALTDAVSGISDSVHYTVEVSECDSAETGETALALTAGKSGMLSFTANADSYVLTAAGTAAVSAALYHGEICVDSWSSLQTAQLLLEPGSSYSLRILTSGSGAACVALHAAPAVDLAAAGETSHQLLPFTKETLPSVFRTKTGEVLAEQTDYLRLVEDSACYFFGIGDYSGYLCVPYREIQVLSLGESPVISPSEGNTVLYQFTAPKTCTYHFSSDYLPEDYQLLCDGGEPSGDPFGTIYDSNFDPMADNDDGGFGRSFCVASNLKAGQTYYLEAGTFAAYGSATYRVVMVQDRVRAADFEVELLSAPAFTGESVRPVLEISYGAQVLAEQEDYLILTPSGSVLGENILYIVGLGAYTSCQIYSYQLEYPDCDTVSQKLICGRPVSINLSGNAVSAYQMKIWEEGEFTLTMPEGIRCLIYTTDDTGAVWRQTALCTETVQLISLESGDYTMLFSGEAQDGVVLLKEATSIADLELAYDAQRTYNGYVQTPNIRLFDGDRQLTESVDYQVTYHGSRAEPGVCEFTVTGLGHYCGTQTGSYRIVMETDASATAELGETTVQITTAGQRQILQFVAETDGMHLFSIDGLYRTKFAVCDAEGVVISQAPDAETASICTGVLSYDVLAPLQKGETYYLTAWYASQALTGEFQVTVYSSYGDLSLLPVVYDTVLTYTGEAVYPEVQFYDGETVLTEGVDYELREASGFVECGTAALYYVGLGRYIGSCTLTYTLVRDSVLESESIAAVLDEPYWIDTLNYGEQLVYQFTAETSGVYAFSILGAWDTVWMQLYNDSGSLLLERSVKLDNGLDVWLSAGETVYAVLSYEDNLAEYSYHGFEFSILEGSLYNIQQGTIVEQDGVRYALRNSGYAEVVGLADASLTQVEIAGEISGCPVTVIHAFAFCGQESLTAVTLPDSMAQIGLCAFMNTGINRIDIPANCTLELYAVGYQQYQAQEAFLLRGYSGDVAEQYAMNNGLQFESIGVRPLPLYTTEVGEVQYLVNPNTGTVCVLGLAEACGDVPEDLVLESSVDGYPVTEIASAAFQDLPELLRVDLPDSLLLIGAYAFANTGLTALSIPPDCVLEEYAAGFMLTATPPVPVSGFRLYAEEHSAGADYAERFGISCVFHPQFTELGGVQYVLFPSEGTAIAVGLSDTALTELTLPDSVEGYPLVAIADGAFYGSNLTSLSLPETIERVGAYALESTALTELLVPEACTLGAYAVGYFVTDTAQELLSEDFVLWGYAESPAEQYASEYCVTFCLWNDQPDLPAEHLLGDVNGDQLVDSDDAVLVLKAYTAALLGQTFGLTESQQTAADVNGDALIDSDDAVKILQYYAKSMVSDVSWEEILGV